MTWTISDLRAADAALSPPISSSADAAAAINAQTIMPPGESVDVSALAVKLLLLRRLEYGSVKDAGHDPALPKAVRAAALTLTTACEDPQVSVIGTSDPALLAAVKAMLGAFVSVEVLSQQTADDLIAMTAPRAAPKWMPAVTAGDIEEARAVDGIYG